MALLPFIDEQRLLGALESVYSELTEEQKQVRVFSACMLTGGVMSIESGSGVSVIVHFVDWTIQRNKLGTDYLFVGQNHAAFNALAVIYELPGNIKVWFARVLACEDCAYA